MDPMGKEARGARGKVLFPVFAALFAVLFLAVVLFPILGSSGGHPMRYAAAARSAVNGERPEFGAADLVSVQFLPAPETKPEDGIFPAALVRFEKGSETVFVSVDNAGNGAVTADGSLFDPAKSVEVSTGFLFDLRFVYLRGLMDGVVYPDTVSPVLVLLCIWFGCALVGYLFGGVNTGIILSTVVFGRDIRKEGSGNPGATNMLRTFGVGPALVTLLGDILKVLVAMTVTALVFGTHAAEGFVANGLVYVTGIFAVMGHIWPVYHKFRGGKGVSCTAALALYTAPIVAGILIVLFVAMVALTRYVSLGSVSAGLLYPVVLNGAFRFMGISADPISVLCSMLAAVLLVYCHRKNLKRLLAGTENKISFKKKD